MIYFTSDLHFGHKNVIDYCNRPFDSVEQMNEEIIANFNAHVKPEDITYFIGDIFFCKKAEAKSILSRMNGTKILIRGNHDFKTSVMYEIGFSAVMEFAQIRLGQTYINLSHYPYKRSIWNHYWKILFDKKYRSKLHFKRLMDDGNFLIHGHTHDMKKVNGRMIHVGVDAWGYRPVSQHQISRVIDDYNTNKSIRLY